MTEDEFEHAMDNYKLDADFANYLCNNYSVGNGHVLTLMMESGDYYEEFKEHMLEVTNG